MTWACSSNNRWLYERGCRGYFPTCGVVSPCINHHFDSLNQFLGLTITRLTNHNHEQNTWDDPLSRESTIFIDHFHREIRDVPHLSVGLPHLEDHPRDRNCQWIGLRENLQESPLNFMGKSMVSCKFSLKPIQSNWFAHQNHPADRKSFTFVAYPIYTCGYQTNHSYYPFFSQVAYNMIQLD